MAASSRIHLRPLKALDLPHLDELSSQQTQGNTPSLQNFVSEVLAEGDKFIRFDDNVFKTNGVRHEPPATAPIQIRSAVITNDPTENWFARTSVHEDSATDGTASWEEFDQNLRVNHSQHESEYTPSVASAEREYSWEQDLQTFGAAVNGWKEITMEIWLMRHAMPIFLLQDRDFRVLVITAVSMQGNRFIVVQIPVDREDIPVKAPNSQSKVVPAIYCSVETGELLDGKITWSMGTASDAKGVLPVALQKTQMAKAVAVDVQYFISWRMKQRKSVN
ncbi:Putative START-like domain superfamily protein [Septoria linicola]|uniref:START-like domain superfamily protein n=1 Tax=Septoria linicola TaxID=215465 RepID=A0A9Q9EFK8_9PEZI|nr:Putative START-like domain superfamily protein [Septoria linicola]